MGTGGDQTAARGASALSDGVRWQLNMRKMSKDEASKFGVEENLRGSFIQMEVSKSNYGTTNEPVLLRREEGGVLVKAVFMTDGVCRNDGNGNRRLRSEY
jgi:hypothetical protein